MIPHIAFVKSAGRDELSENSCACLPSANE
jgi:hypothetical protein